MLVCRLATRWFVAKSPHTFSPFTFFMALMSLSLVLFNQGCASVTPTVSTRVFHNTDLLSSASTHGDPSLSEKRIELSAAINETVSFQFTITTASHPLLRPSFTITPPTTSDSHLDPSVIEIFRLEKVKLGAFPGWHERLIPPNQRKDERFDVLVPLDAPRGGWPEVLQPNQTYSFWVDVSIPKGAFEGNYSAAIQFKSDEKIIDIIQIRFKVWPFILPDQNVIPFLADLDHRALFYHHIRNQGRPFAPARDDWQNLPMKAEMDALLTSTLQLLQRHRLTPVLPKLSPLVKVNTLGKVVMDWRAYDSIVTPIMNGRIFANRIPTPSWPLPLQAVFSSQHTLSNKNRDSSARGSDQFRTQFLKACTDHFAQKKWLSRAFAMLPDDGDIDPQSVEAFQHFADTVQKGTNKCRILSKRIPQDMQPFGWIDYPYTDLSSYVDIWSPPAQFFDVKTMTEIRAKKSPTWITLDRPPYSGSTSIFAPSTYTRVLSWQAERLGAEAVRMGTVNRWPEYKMNPTPQECIEHDSNVLLYPGAIFGLSHPVTTIRLKHLRRSLQDAAYRSLLDTHGLSHISQALSKAISPYAGSDAYGTHFADGRKPGWLNQPWQYELARNIMAEQLLQNMYSRKPSSRVESFAQSAQWRRFMLSAKKIDLQVDGCRVRLTQLQPTFAAEIECSVTLTNHTRSPLSGTIQFTELSHEIVAESSTRRMSAIPPYESRHITLSATLRALPVESTGIFRWPILFTTDDGNEHHVDAHVSMIMAANITGSLRIDGNLKDWPPGDTNIVSDFQLITGGDTFKPSTRTLGLVMRDHEYLYVAINCILSPNESITFSNKNTVEYEDMIPVGEDLIELLFDPLNSGTRSPSDLYHIAIKPGGAYLTEQGIDFSSPCSRRKHWPADPVIATRIRRDGWSAEIRIPLSSFGVNPSQSSIWGFSITHKNAAHQEFSTSSAAVGNAYDPMSLGNLFIP